MATNIKLLPLLRVDFEIADNEDWLDSLPVFVMAGEADGYRSPTNTGTGTIGSVAADPTASVGDHTVTITSVDGGTSRLRVTDADGNVEGLGVVGTPVSAGGLTFTVTQGATAFVAGDGFDIVVLPTPVDLTGIEFTMAVRRSATGDTIYGAASTGNGQIVNGGATGVPAVHILRSVKQFEAGSFVIDMLAKADGLTKRVVGQIGTAPSTLTVHPGVTPAS